jgi:hypothetical protein
MKQYKKEEVHKKMCTIGFQESAQKNAGMIFFELLPARRRQTELNRERIF